MFLRIFLYKIKTGIRNKDYFIWNLVFPFLLGTLFFTAFSSIYSEEKIDQINVAIVDGNKEDDSVVSKVKEVFDNIEFDNGKKMFSIKEESIDGGRKLLQDKKCDGVMIVNSMQDIKLEIRDNGVNESILTEVVNAYKNQIEIKEFVKTKGFTAGNKDPYIQYMYNLIAMIAMLSTSPAMCNIIESNANMTKVGLRIDISPINKPIYQLATAASAYVIQLVITLLSLVYYVYILGMDFGAPIWILALTGFLAAFLGNSMGFLVGSIGNAKEGVKNGILLTIVLIGGFLSGLMVGQMRMIVEEKFPIINRINPSAVITDAFYTLNVYGVSERYYNALLYMGVLGVVFTLIGVVLSKRSSYASV